jgi:O-antigen/teichoic acid export membrane protein
LTAEETHRGEGAVLGVRVLRYSGVQGVAMLGASILHLVTIFVVAAFLGPSELGRFALLYFGANLLAQVLTIAVKPGTIRRTFADDDEEDDDGEDADDVSANPKRSLGTGLLMAGVLSTAGAAIAIVLREPIAEGLLGDASDSDLIVWAAVLGAATVLFKLVSIVIWFERRPGAFLACELSRPVLALGLVTGLLAGGAGLEAVLIGNAAGTILAALVGVIVLRGSFDPVIDFGEVGPILHRGMLRAPIMSSFWALQQGDVFLLSRFVSDADLGIYTLASRIGFIAAFMPQGFRVALRPLRRASLYKSVEDQYGRAEQRGQLLGYFVLLCISAVLAMVLAGSLIVELAPSSFADAAPLIPLTAAGMVLPALLRTVNQQTSWPGRTRRTFVACSLLAVVLFTVATILLAPGIGTYAAPIGMIVGLGLPCVYLFVRAQNGPDRINFPYREVGTGLVVAIVVGAVHEVLPSLPIAAEAAVALAFGALYVALLFALRVIPETHWEALSHMVQSLVSGRPDAFRPRRGLRALAPDERAALRAAVGGSWAAGGTAAKGQVAEGEEGNGHGPVASAELVGALRRAGERGGAPVGAPTEYDGQIAAYVFSAAPTAVRNAQMRDLLAEDAEASDLRTLEDLVAHLATIPDGAWDGERKNAPKDGG